MGLLNYGDLRTVELHLGLIVFVRFLEVQISFGLYIAFS